MRPYLLYGVFWVLVLGGVWAPAAHADTPGPCEVTAGEDTDPITGAFTPGSFRQKLVQAMAGLCTDQKIIFKVPKVIMNAPLGAAIFSALKGLTVEPAPTISQIEMQVKYDTDKAVVGCSAESPFNDCFVYLPTSDVTIRNMRVAVDTASAMPPTRGLCIDHDENAKIPSDNKIFIEGSAFDGFSGGGIVISSTANKIKISKTTFSGSSEGIVVEEDPTGTYLTNTPQPPAMGGSNAAVFARVDAKGHVIEYRLRGLSTLSTVTQPDAGEKTDDDNTIVTAELFESDGKSGTKFLQTCELHNTDLVDGKWNIECVLLPPLALPFNYAITVTNKSGSTSMFSMGTIPSDVAKVPIVTPSTPQGTIKPPESPVAPQNPPLFQDTRGGDADQNKTPPLTLSAGSFGGGCSLIRQNTLRQTGRIPRV